MGLGDGAFQGEINKYDTRERMRNASVPPRAPNAVDNTNSTGSAATITIH